MRPKRFSYTFSALDANGFCENVTGNITVTAWTTLDGTLPPGKPTDGVAHQTTLASTSNLGAITVTITGTDAEGRVHSEDILGPNNNTVTLTKYFKTVTSVLSSATLGEDTMNVGWTALCKTPAIPCDYARPMGPMVSISTGGTIVYEEEQSASPIFTTANADVVWNEFNPFGQPDAGSTAVRARITSHTAGTMTMDISQMSE